MKPYCQLTEAEKQALTIAQQEGRLELQGVFGDWRKAVRPIGRGGKDKRGSKGVPKDYPFQDDVIYRIAN